MKYFKKIFFLSIISLLISQFAMAQSIVFDMHTSAVGNTICRNEPFTLYMTPIQNIRYVFEFSIDGGSTWNPYTNLSSDVSAYNQVSQSITLVTSTQFRVFYTTNTSVGSTPDIHDPTIIDVTVNQLPDVQPITYSSNIVCQNSDITYSDITSAGVWSSTNESVATVGSSTGIVHGVGQGSAIIKYVVTDPLTGCKNQDSKPITVNPTPMISSYSASVCSGVLYSVTPSGSVPSGTTFSWPMPTSNAPGGELTILAASATSTQTTVNALLTNSSSSVYIATYSITATKGSCVSVPFNLNLSVTPKPIIADRIVQACSGAHFSDAPANGSGNIVPAGIKYSWSSPLPISNLTGLSSGTNQNDFNGTLTNSTSSIITAVYTVSTFNLGCPGTTFTETVNVNPTPNITVNPISTCSNAPFTVSINDGGGNIVPASTTYSWSAPSMTGITGLQSGTNTTTITGILANTTSSTISNIIYSITPTSGSLLTGFCSGPAFTLNVTVNPIPIISPMGPTQTGSGSAFNFLLGNVGDIVPVGTTYFWGTPSVPVGITGQAASGTSTATSLTGTLFNPTATYLDAIYTIIPSYANCQGSSFTYTVRVYPKPIIGPKSVSICSGQSFGPIVLTDGANGDVIPGGTTYSWNAPVYVGITGTATATAAGTISGTLNNTTNYAITVIYVVTPFASPQAGDPFNVSVTVNPLPIASIVVTENSGLHANDNIICNDVNANIAAVPIVGALTDYSYAWTVPAGGTSPGNTANFSSGIAGTYGLMLTSTAGCVSAVQTTTSLTVNNIPTVGPIIGPSNVCVNSTITLQTSSISGGSGIYSLYYWYDGGVLVHAPFNTNTVSVTGNNAGIGNITYKVQDDNGCFSAASNPVFVLNVNALPQAPTAVSINQPYDGQLHTGAAIAANPSTEQIEWYLNLSNTDPTTSVAPSATNVGPTVTSYALARNSTTNCISPNRTRVTVTITQKALSVIANDFIKTYDRTLYTGGNGVIYNGFVPGENESVLTGLLSYSGTAQNAMNAGIYSIIPTGLSSGNYAITMVAGQLKINQKGLTITGATVLDKVYDATDIANMNAGALSGVILADLPNVTLNRSAKFSSKNVGANLVITSTSTITGSAANNYVLDPTINVQASITPKHINAVGLVTSNKIYDGTADAAVSGGSFNTAITPGSGSSSDQLPYLNDNIQLVPSGNFASKDVGNNIAITSTATIAGSDKNNYILDQPTLVARNITPKALNMNGLSITEPKIYDGTTKAFLSGTAQLLTAEAPRTGTVLDGLAYTNDVVGITGTPVGTYNSKDVNTANSVSISGIALSGSGAGNYTLNIQPAIASSILPKVLTMFGLSVPSSKVYDGNRKATVNGTAHLQTAELINTGNILDGKPYTIDDVSIQGTPVGTYDNKNVSLASSVQYSGISLTGDQSSNYHLAVQSDALATITPLPLKVIADAQSKIYGEVDPILTYTNEPLVDGDQFTGALDRTAGEDIGYYNINLGTLSLGDNYAIQFVPNNLEIKAAPVIIKPDPVIRTYGDTPLPNTFVTTNFQAIGLKKNEQLGGITLTIPSGPGSGNDLKDSVATYSQVVTASNPKEGTAKLANYQFKFLPADIIVQKYQIVITAEPKQKRQSQPDPLLTYLVSRPLVVGDSLTGSLTRMPGVEVGFYPILQGTLKINNNYDIQFVSDNLEILTIERVIVVPNAFTPNNDGLNDVIKVLHNSTISSLNYFKIFNRAGQQIFETKDLNQGWDGRVNGVIAEADAYYWILEYITWDDKTFKMNGSFILLK